MMLNTAMSCFSFPMKSGIFQATQKDKEITLGWGVEQRQSQSGQDVLRSLPLLEY